MKSLLMLFAMMVVVMDVQGMHVHPRGIVRMEESQSDDIETTVAEIDGTSIEEIRNIRPNRFVPINSVLFFKSYPPCEDGMERDLIGICREVW